MLYRVLVPLPILLVPSLFMSSNCHTVKNNSDVIVTYGGHSEITEGRDAVKPLNNRSTTEKIETTTVKKEKKEEEKIVPKEFGDFVHLLYRESEESTEKVTEETRKTQDGVVFIPNHEYRDVVRNEEYLMKNPISFNDFMAKEPTDAKMVEETEPPQDIIFINGRNNENENIFDPLKEKDGPKTIKQPKLNCTHLDCDNSIKSLCGGKIEHSKWKYRLFLNECFFRKVNCNFKKRENRYEQVSLDKCQNVAAHVSEAPLSYPHLQRYYVEERPKPRIEDRVKKQNNTRRLAGRRSLSMGVNGRVCSHICPISCPEDYEPECGVSSTGNRKVFVNHCKMDYNSCVHNIVWYRRPLAECVGGKKADMRQNRGFINWLQTVGIVDNKGKLVLS